MRRVNGKGIRSSQKHVGILQRQAQGPHGGGGTVRKTGLNQSFVTIVGSKNICFFNLVLPLIYSYLFLDSYLRHYQTTFKLIK